MSLINPYTLGLFLLVETFFAIYARHYLGLSENKRFFVFGVIQLEHWPHRSSHRRCFVKILLQNTCAGVSFLIKWQPEAKLSYKHEILKIYSFFCYFGWSLLDILKNVSE